MKSSKFAIDLNPIVEGFLSVFDGEATAAYDAEALSLAYCRRVQDDFANSSSRHVRKDGVPGDEIGATQYGKQPAEYMRQASATRGVIETLLGGYEGEIPALLRAIATAVTERGWRVRPTVYQGEPAPTIRLVRWLKAASQSRFVLRPHDDFAQTRGYADWEISETKRVIAINFYLSGVAESGQLVVGRWRPSAAEREQLGVASTGYPYEDHYLLHGPHAVLPAKTGSAVVLDGSHVHGVALGDGNVENRLVANCFFGLNDETREVVIWA